MTYITVTMIAEAISQLPDRFDTHSVERKLLELNPKEVHAELGLIVLDKSIQTANDVAERLTREMEGMLHTYFAQPVNRN